MTQQIDFSHIPFDRRDCGDRKCKAKGEVVGETDKYVTISVPSAPKDSPQDHEHRHAIPKAML